MRLIFLQWKWLYLLPPSLPWNIGVFTPNKKYTRGKKIQTQLMRGRGVCVRLLEDTKNLIKPERYLSSHTGLSGTPSFELLSLKIIFTHNFTHTKSAGRLTHIYFLTVYRTIKFIFFSFGLSVECNISKVKITKTMKQTCALRRNKVKSGSS